LPPDADVHWHQEGFLHREHPAERPAVFQTAPTGLKAAFAPDAPRTCLVTSIVATAAWHHDGTTNRSSAIRFAPGSLQVQNWFTPFNWPDPLTEYRLERERRDFDPEHQSDVRGRKVRRHLSANRDHPGKLEGTNGEPCKNSRLRWLRIDCAQTLGTAF
jgi:hypothetical protein